MRSEVGQHCWRATLFQQSTQSEVIKEIFSEENETENETVRKLCYEMNKLFIEEDFGTEDDVQELVTGSEKTRALIPENQEQKLPKNRKFSLQSQLYQKINHENDYF